MTPSTTTVALVTGGSMGLGRHLVSALCQDSWHVILNARDAVRLERSVTELGPGAAVTALPGDVADPRHRRRLADAVTELGRLDLLVNNASVLGPSPQPALRDYPLHTLDQVFAVNTMAPLALFQLVRPLLQAAGGVVVNVSSDAAVEAYPGWGGYGAAKAALDRLTAVLGVEHPELAVYAVDPGDMNTDLHQQAFPGEDIGDRPSPASVVPAVLELLRRRPPSGRYRAADLVTAAPVQTGTAP